MRMALEKQAVKLVLCALCLLGLSFSIRSGMAQQAAPETPASQSAPAPPAAPSEAHLAAAKALVVASGISRSFSIIIPQFLDQIGASLTQTRPELRSDLNVVLTQLKPEFDLKVEEMIGIAGQIYAKQMSGQELRAAAAFFESPAGRKYVESQPAFLTEVVTAMQGWQGKISTDLMARVRSEMKKKGHEL
ncbi:MAG: DUF2059 domain-containing protein [Beijerinckiaceae bacterium]|nr:DUF2059 domain-containing protein [Beijerinckiaceae bacterium]